MANLHPRTLAALEAGPQKVNGPIVMNEQTLREESPAEFARRIALIAMEEEREAVYEEERKQFAEIMESIRRRGKP